MDSTDGARAGLRIGDVARETGIAVDTIRFYERLQVVRHPPRSVGGFRLYTDADIGELRFVRRLQALGLSLAEIRQLTAVRAGRRAACREVRDLLARKLDDVREQLRVLQTLERELASDLRACMDSRADEAPGVEGECPVLDDLRTLDAHEGTPSGARPKGRAYITAAELTTRRSGRIARRAGPRCR